MSIIDALVQNGLLKEGQIARVLKSASEKYNNVLDDALIAEGMDEQQILSVKSSYYNIPAKTIDPKQVPFELFKYIPEESATQYGLVPLALNNSVLEVGIVDPDNMQALDALQFISAKSNIPFKVFLIARSAFKGIVGSYHGMSGEVQKAVTTDEELDSAVSASAAPDADDLSKPVQQDGADGSIVEDAPIIKIVAVMLRNAIEGGASDIHIEHTGDRVKVRFRVDGILHTTLVLPINVYAGVIARVKILSQLRLDEKRKPQDGGFSAKINGRKVDFRVSILPAYYGEKVVIRILDNEKGVRPIDQLGLSSENLAMLREAIKRPFGLILVTGPTGSGKTTTLYSILNELDRETLNIVSLEDPVEYHIPGVNQSQVLPEIGYTFASGLRSILRQDPNIIMVGEIRDKETAQLAIQAALTGHLVFSTLHTNNAMGVIPRLIDMGVDPYLIAPTLIMAIGQRLVRTVCPASRKEKILDEATRTMLTKQFADLPDAYRSKLPFTDKMFDVIPSPECPSGTKGRMSIYEMFMVDKDIEKVILNTPTEPEIYKAVREKGMLTMREDAILKALKGDIPMQEVYNFEA